MRFRNGLAPDAKGGHGPIRYTVEKCDPEGYVRFAFRKPKGFHGTYTLSLEKNRDTDTRITHKIDAQIKKLFRSGK